MIFEERVWSICSLLVSDKVHKLLFIIWILVCLFFPILTFKTGMVIHFEVILHNIASTLLVFIQVLIGRTLLDLPFHLQKWFWRLILTSCCRLDNSLTEHILICIRFGILGSSKLILFKSSYSLDLLIYLLLESFD